MDSERVQNLLIAVFSMLVIIFLLLGAIYIYQKYESVPVVAGEVATAGPKESAVAGRTEGSQPPVLQAYRLKERSSLDLVEIFFYILLVAVLVLFRKKIAAAWHYVLNNSV